MTSSDRFDGSSRCGFVYQAVTLDHLQWLKWLPLDPIRIISTKTSRTRAPHRVGTLQSELSTLIFETTILGENYKKRSNHPMHRHNHLPCPTVFSYTIKRQAEYSTRNAFFLPAFGWIVINRTPHHIRVGRKNTSKIFRAFGATPFPLDNVSFLCRG